MRGAAAAAAAVLLPPLVSVVETATHLYRGNGGERHVHAVDSNHGTLDASKPRPIPATTTTITPLPPWPKVCIRGLVERPASGGKREKTATRTDEGDIRTHAIQVASPSSKKHSPPANRVYIMRHNIFPDASPLNIRALGY